MNETDWQGGADLVAMLDYLDGKISDRKLRLFACACVRRHWGRLRYPTPRQTVELAERFAEGQAGAQEVEEMRQNAEMSAGNAPEFEQPLYGAAAAALAQNALEAARNAQDLCRQQAVRDAAYSTAPSENEAAINARESAEECEQQARLLREIVGNPFRPVAIDPNWLRFSAGAVGGMARVIDEDHRFSELPYLADALTDAGCTNEAILSHLRQEAPHILGCWALDACLGRS